MTGRRNPAIVRVLEKCEPGPNGCVIFTGAINGWGYGQIKTGHTTTPAHRVTWEDKHGPIPPGQMIDHVCGVRACVNVEHLRLLTQTANRQAIGKSRRNSSGFRGVYKSGSRWVAQVRAEGQVHYLGRYDTPEEAGEVARQGRLRLHSAHSQLDQIRP